MRLLLLLGGASCAVIVALAVIVRSEQLRDDAEEAVKRAESAVAEYHAIASGEALAHTLAEADRQTVERLRQH